MKGEGFIDVQFGDRRMTGALPELASGAADIGITFSGPTIIPIDVGDPVTVLAGVHVGCFEVIATERVRRLTDLRGKIAGVPDRWRLRPRGPDPVLRDRLHEIGMIKSSPRQIIAQGTDWRFLNELRRELVRRRALGCWIGRVPWPFDATHGAGANF